ncbi:hypothetical protein FOYG_15562 [Fusarium oxysporum NRRL 32931]|uniref:Uncharacterized protein n=1 Tax=Fusarium oxysporum NRRL 32931 TaxID=660029 RepID=W9HGB9_FUSOX|nr:hypothetical protein FOYG_15562 [Fusarium oxysporum NRRL 32931]
MDDENALPRAKSIARRKTVKATLVLGFAPVIGGGHVLICFVFCPDACHFHSRPILLSFRIMLLYSHSCANPILMYMRPQLCTRHKIHSTLLPNNIKAPRFPLFAIISTPTRGTSEPDELQSMPITITPSWVAPCILPYRL